MASTAQIPGHISSLSGRLSSRKLSKFNDGANESRIKRATRTRMIWSITSSVCLFITLVFLILVEVGSTYNKAVLVDLWFMKLNLSNIIPSSVPNSVVLNSIAQTLGLHDFYQVGLWNWCEGYFVSGVTKCRSPTLNYYFNPVTIIQGQLLAGSSLNLPSDINYALDLVRTASKVMFAFFLTGSVLSFVLIFLEWIAVYSRWVAFAIALATLFNALLVVIAAGIATALFAIMRNKFVSATQVDIEAELGINMFACMWVAAAFSVFALVIELSLTCCCASRRDVRRGKKMGSLKAWA